MRSLLVKILITVTLSCCATFVYAQAPVIRVAVLDENGAAIPGAKVKITTNNGSFSFCRTEEVGKFSCEPPLNAAFTLQAEAQGFSILRRNYDKTQDFSVEQVFTLKPELFAESIFVTANLIETRPGETPASIISLAREDIQTAGAPLMDDVLRQATGFSIFRRSTSRNANPTTQGVSLRGAGASGASRSLVLFDGVPLNDPFGGWVQWNRVSPIGVETAEVLRGGASSLYGNGSLSGTINMLPRKINDTYVFSAEVFGGSQNTMAGSVFAGFHRDGWTGDVTASSYQTKGYIPIDEAVRGPADVYAGVRSTNFTGRIGRQLGDLGEIFFRPSFFGEVRTNGTGLQTNRTHSRQFSLGGRFDKLGLSGSRLDWQIYTGSQVYDQVFSAVNTARTAESLTRTQRVPAQVIGFSERFTIDVKNHTLLFGFEARQVRGASDETIYTNELPSSLVGAGGRENTLGFFAQDFIRVGSRLVVTGRVRYDEWRNVRAFSTTRTLSNNRSTTTGFPDRKESALSPQGAILYQINGHLSIQAQASRSFRAPTLNELYRNFRVGNALTLANENLQAEKADNFEAGVSYRKGNSSIRATAYWSEISNAVSNVTLSTTPSLITRQRQNAGRLRTRGFEIEGDTRFERLALSAGYLFADSTVADFPSNPQLVGLAVPQVARHQFTFQAKYAAGTWTLAMQGRASTAQFDDDLNLFRLEPYFQTDIFASKRLRVNLTLFTGIENIFNSRYSIGRTPIRTVSSPINIRAGVRWN